MANVKKIVLDIDGKEIKLNLGQAKKLRDILVDLWPENRTNYVPYYVDRYLPRPRYSDWTLTYGSTNDWDNSSTMYMSSTSGVNNG